jgi:hypothetical protein
VSVPGVINDSGGVDNSVNNFCGEPDCGCSRAPAGRRETGRKGQGSEHPRSTGGVPPTDSADDRQRRRPTAQPTDSAAVSFPGCVCSGQSVVPLLCVSHDGPAPRATCGSGPSPAVLSVFADTLTAGRRQSRASPLRPISAAAPPPACGRRSLQPTSRWVGSMARMKGRLARRMLAGPIWPGRRRVCLRRPSRVCLHRPPRPLEA